MHSRQNERRTGRRHRRRGVRQLSIALVALTAVTACGSDDDADVRPSTDDDSASVSTAAETTSPAEEPDSSGTTAATSAPDAAAFPVTVEHRFGSTTVPEIPDRIVTVGLTEQDALLAFGVVPVATTEWFGEEPGAIWPWAQDELSALQGETPEIVGDATKVNYEAVAAQRPDLILAIYSGLTQEDYDRLSEIAPTVAQPGEYVDYGVPWEDLTRTVGKVVGRATEAEALIDEVNARFAEAKEAHPEFNGASAVTATPYEGIFVYGPEDVRGRMLTSLGFELPPGLVEATGEEFGGDLSEERADLLDVDAIVWLDAEDGEGPLGGPLYETFDVHRQGREVHLDSEGDPLGGATSFVSALSLPYLLDGLVPMLAAAVDGDPDTEVPTADEVESAPDASTATTEASTSETSATDAGSTTEATDTFPVTVEHAQGTTEIPAEPQRIVTVGYTEQDTVLALGLQPVGVTEWYGEQPNATWPWAQDELGDATPEVLSQADGLQYERIAALQPDLILGLNAGLDADSYARLSAIAPTIAQPVGAEAYFSPWRDITRLIGTAVGRTAAAEALIDDIDGQFADAKAAHPEWAGEKVIFLQNAFYDGEAIAYQEGLSTDFLTDLGFDVPSEIDEFVQGNEGSQAYIPLEQLSVLDAADVLLWATEAPDDRTELEKVAVYNALEEVRDGRLIFTDGLTAGAIYFTSPLSLPFVLEQIVPAFETTLAGDGPADAFGAD